MVSPLTTTSKAASDAGSILEAKQLTRRFGGLVAVNSVSFTVNKNEIFGLIGTIRTD